MLDLNYRYTVDSMLPSNKRTSIRKDYIYMKVNHLNDTNEKFTADFEEQKFFAMHDSKVASIEHLVNTLTNPNVFIYIEDGIFYDDKFIYTYNEYNPFVEYIHLISENIDDGFIYTINETEFDQYNFFVIMDSSDVALVPLVYKLVKLYKPAVKRFAVKIDGVIVKE